MHSSYATMEINIYQHIRNEQETQPAAVAAVIGGRRLSHVQGNNTLQRSGNIVFVWFFFFIRILRTRLALAHRRNNGRRGNVEEEANAAPRDFVRTPGTHRRESGEPEHEVANVLVEKSETPDAIAAHPLTSARPTEMRSYNYS